MPTKQRRALELSIQRSHHHTASFYSMLLKEPSREYAHTIFWSRCLFTLCHSSLLRVAQPYISAVVSSVSSCHMKELSTLCSARIAEVLSTSTVQTLTFTSMNTLQSSSKSWPIDLLSMPSNTTAAPSFSAPRGARGTAMSVYAPRRGVASVSGWSAPVVL